MLDVLQETLLYIEQQHDWLAYIQSVIGENEEKYKLLHSQTTFHISKELNKHELRCDNEQAPVKQKHYDGDFEAGAILNVLQQNLLYIEQRHNWFAYIESDIDEKKQKCKILSTKITEELNNQESKECSNTNAIVVIVEQEWDSDTEVTYDEATSSRNWTAESNQHIKTNKKLPETLLAQTNLLQQSTNTTENHYECSFCCKTFSRKQYLIGHQRLHTGEKPFECLVCESKFRESRFLTKHMRIHSDEKPFKCSVCSKSFRQKDSMVNHVRIHTGEKPYVCSFCKRPFRERSSMVVHMRIHTGEKPYNCCYCSKSFRESRTLTKHMRTHTGEKPFICKYCSRPFARSDTLKNHLKSIHSS